MFGWAVKEQHEPLLSILLAHDYELQHVYNIPLSDDGLPALHLASKFGQQNIVQMLLNICDVNRQDREGYTALHYAAVKGHVAIIYMLIMNNGIKIDLRSETGLTPLSLAASNGHVDVLKALLESMVNTEAPKPVPLPKADVEARGVDRRTPLIQAAKGGHLEAVELLVSYGADADARDAIDFTPLAWAIKRRHKEIMNFLFELGLTWVPNGVGSEDILLMASSRGDEVLVRKLLTAESINIEAKDLDQRTSLSWAAGNGHISVVELLLGKGAMIASSFINGNSPLLWASRNKHGAIAALFVQRIINNIIELSFTPIASRKVRWSGYMMSSNLADHNGVWRYFVLLEHSLTMYKSWATVSKDEILKSLDTRFHTPTSTPLPCDLCRLPPERSRLKDTSFSVGYNDQLYHFFLRHGSHTISDRLANPFDEKRQCFHFAVTTEQERIDWMRELGLVRAY
jgi:ankyrin repeat protein